MTQKDIDEVSQAFVLSAKRLKSIGADGIQLHAAHGFLLSEFLSPALNRRADSYGADRTRIVFEIASEIRRSVGKDFLISAKINGEDCIEGGVTAPFCAEYVKKLSAVINFFEISCNASPLPFAVRADFDPELLRSFIKSPEEAEQIAAKAAKMFAGVPYFEGYNVPATKVVKAEMPSVKLAAVGGIRNFAFMEALVKDGVADVVSLSRPFLRQPDLVKVLKKEGIESVDCISCGLCMLGLSSRGCKFPKKRKG
jgi:2,4-dienoyl-CoA reductase-like NADH-dependent reductase (Old Yellow Enzyme family)